jgi:hypothetical protein
VAVNVHWQPWLAFSESVMITMHKHYSKELFFSQQRESVESVSFVLCVLSVYVITEQLFSSLLLLLLLLLVFLLSRAKMAVNNATTRHKLIVTDSSARVQY